jgi:hypothetical protein
VTGCAALTPKGAKLKEKTLKGTIAAAKRAGTSLTRQDLADL